MVKKMGSLRGLFEKLPGMGGILDQVPADALDDGELVKLEAMIQSMTRQERNDPDVLDRSRMERIARGSGRPYEEVESLYQRFLEMRQMMGSLGSSGMFDGVPGLGDALGGGGRAARRAAKRRGGMPQIPGGMMPPSMMGGEMPGLGGGGAPTLSKEERAARAKERKAKRKAKNAQRKKKGRR